MPLLAPAADQDVVGLALRPRDRLEADARERRRRVRRAPKEANKLFNVENEYFDDSFLQFHAISEIRIKFLEMFINVAHHLAKILRIYIAFSDKCREIPTNFHQLKIKLSVKMTTFARNTFWKTWKFEK